MKQAKVWSRWVRPLWLVGCLMAVGCAKKEEPAPQPVVTPPAPEARTPEAQTPTPTPEAQEPTPTPEAPPPAPTPPPATGEAVPEDPKNREWTAGNVTLKRTSQSPVTLRSVRAARNEGFDRVVFEFDGMQLPGYRLEYVDKPVIKCGSGDPTEVAGQGWLQVSLTPAQAHEGAQATVAERERKPALPLIQELELTCDFEGEVTWVLGNARPNKYRVMELREPTRLVVDVQH
jgi:hypothetical protein